MKSRLGLALFYLVFFPNVSLAQWAMDGAPLTLVPGGQYTPNVVSDGVGGAIVVWQDDRNGASDIYAQRVNSKGAALWAANGVALCTAPGTQWVLAQWSAIVSDGAGGAILVWQDDRSGTGDVYVQRVNSAGVPQWAADGVPVCVAANLQEFPVAIADGSGGVVVAWQDYRGGTNYDVYAQRVNAAGAVQWTANGVLLCADGTDQDSHQITSDGSSGAIVTWRDWRYGAADHDIFAQRINGTGALQWSPSGNSMCSAFGNQQLPQLVSDGAGGAVIGWSDYRTTTNWDIYAQRVNPSGTPLWGSTGAALCVDSQDQRWPAISTDGKGGAVVAWHDFRLFSSDVFCQRVSAAGVPHWTANGVPVCTAANTQQNIVVAPDGADGFIVAWTDIRGGVTFDFANVFAQRLNATGAAQWAFDGISVCGASDDQGFPVIALDGEGGTLFAWGDARSGGYEVCAQRIHNIYGNWGHPEPIIESVEDTPHDQGGKVAVNWAASGRDLPNPRTIDFYSVWRAVDAIPVGAATVASADLSTLAADDVAPVYLVTPDHYFERVGTQSAHGWPGYSFAASTRADSVASATGDEVFMVAAHLIYDSYVAFASNEVMGHSVDNLAPLTPFLLTAQRVGADVQLNWNRAVAPDLRDYAIYRATASGVTPVPIHFLASAEDTLAVDANAPSSALYYIVTAYDVHANQSSPSNEASVGGSTGIGNTPALTAVTVLQNHPNPFAATTDFEVGLPKSADVSVDVFDVAGRRVSAFEVNGAKAGWNRIPFAGRDDRGRPLASGVYFYRIRAAGATTTKKMVIAR